MNVLFHEDAIVAPLGSGSRGNATYIGDGRRGVLVDCGLSSRQIFERLSAVGLGDTRIVAVLITHEHLDHVGGARVLQDRLLRRHGVRVPVYMTAGTEVGAPRRCLPPVVERLRSGETVFIGDRRPFRVEPFTVPHDTSDPVAYVVQVGGVRVGVITDLGRSTHLVERMVSSLDVAVLEFNHDVEMLLEGDYPWSLKQRVRGNHGHLSNAQSAALIARGASDRLEHLVLAHLSDDNNTPELALEAAQEALHGARCTGVSVAVAHQQVPLAPMRLRTPMTFRPALPRRRRRARPEPVAEAPTLQMDLFS